MSTKLLNYNPFGEEVHMGLHDRFREQWLAASREKDSDKRRIIKADCHRILAAMRHVRMKQYRTTYDVGRRALRIIMFRAYRLGVEDMIRPLPEPEVFRTLEHVRVFFQEKSRDVRWAGENSKVVRALVRENDLRPRPRESGYIMTLNNIPGMLEFVPFKS